MKKSIMKTFKRFIKEGKEKYYTLDLHQNMTKEDIAYCMNELLPLTIRMLKTSDVMISIEPVFDNEEL